MFQQPWPTLLTSIHYKFPHLFMQILQWIEIRYERRVQESQVNFQKCFRIYNVLFQIQSTIFHFTIEQPSIYFLKTKRSQLKTNFFFILFHMFCKVFLRFFIGFFFFFHPFILSFLVFLYSDCFVLKLKVFIQEWFTCTFIS